MSQKKEKEPMNLKINPLIIFQSKEQKEKRIKMNRTSETHGTHEAH